MRIFQSLRKQVETPVFLGFLCSLVIHLGAIGWFFGVFDKQEKIAQTGFSSFTMNLASINTNANQKAYSTPTKPQHKHKKAHKKKHKTKNPIPTQEILTDETEETTEQKTSQETKPTTQTSEEINDTASNQDSQGSTQEALAYNEGISDEFYRKVQEAISKKHHYPRLAQIRELQGTVTVEFILNVDGSIEHIKVFHSDTGDILNQQALKTIKEAHKNFPIPAKKVRLKIPIVYGIQS